MWLKFQRLHSEKCFFCGSNSTDKAQRNILMWLKFQRPFFWVLMWLTFQRPFFGAQVLKADLREVCSYVAQVVQTEQRGGADPTKKQQKHKKNKKHCKTREIKGGRKLDLQGGGHKLDTGGLKKGGANRTRRQIYLSIYINR